jgi:hypothetical protein
LPRPKRLRCHLVALGCEDEFFSNLLGAVYLAANLGHNLRTELTLNQFYHVLPELASLMEDPAPFSTFVNEQFPEAVRDICAASRCLALDEWTASVFHCMRVVEHGLRAMAEYLGVTMKYPIELENWKTIIDAIEKAIYKIEDENKSLEKSERLRFYSGAATQFRYFKDAWRNHVSHSRRSYDSREARLIWNHTCEFMESLAASIPQERQ